MAKEAMSREEVSALGSARREEVRRQIENTERLRANPLLYLVSPQVKVRNIFFRYFFCNNFKINKQFKNKTIKNINKLNLNFACIVF